jgi:hypothetical protein
METRNVDLDDANARTRVPRIDVREPPPPTLPTRLHRHMTREEAIADAARLSREHPERDRFTWMPRKAAGGQWEIARVRVPSRAPQDLHTGTAENPIAPRDDPRPPLPPDQMGVF